jgi:hypothetical protein
MVTLKEKRETDGVRTNDTLRGWPDRNKTRETQKQDTGWADRNRDE